jgi:hypothetical protein
LSEFNHIAGLGAVPPVGSNAQVAFGDAAGQVRNDLKADLIPTP